MTNKTPTKKMKKKKLVNAIKYPNNNNNDLRVILEDVEKEMLNDTNWDDLENIYNGLMGGTLNIAKTLKNILTVKDVRDNVENPTKFNDYISMLTDDINKLITALNRIHDKHKGFRGKITTPDELMTNIEIFNEYTTLQDNFQQLIMQPYAEITQMVMTINITQPEQKIERSS